MIDVTCPQCGDVYHADPVHVGKRIRCTKCDSLLPIRDTGRTVVRKPPEASGVRQSKSRFERRAARSSPLRSAFRLGFMVVVALVAVGLLILWRHFNAYEGTSPVLRYRTGEPQTSSQ